MISIDNVIFDFVVSDEEFATGMYSDWDSFCHKCFEQVVEECFMSYDKEDNIYEIDSLDLDLGTISEDAFYDDFPSKLKDELKKVVFSGVNQIKVNRRTSSSIHIDKILHGLRYGHVNGDDGIDLDIESEIEWLQRQSVSEREECIDEIARFVLTDPNALHRMILHARNDAFLLKVYRTAIAMQEFTVWQKNQFLMSFLELDGIIPVNYIHDSDGKNDLALMAELLDSRSVRSIMHIEMERQTKEGMSSYWHYLYEWLLRYYPYNDVSLFGGKAQFVNHLHLRFLTFIYNHPYLSYLSEYELTLEFLIEVFGRDQYMHVAEAINRLLRQNVGNLAYFSTHGRDLYMSFMRISLMNIQVESDSDVEDGYNASDKDVLFAQCRQIIELPDVTEKIKTIEIARLWDRSRDAYAETIIMLNNERMFAQVMTLTDSSVIKDIFYYLSARVYDNEALEALRLMSGWIKNNIPDKDVQKSLLVPVSNDNVINRMLATVSLSLQNSVQELKMAVKNKQDKIAWLRGLSDSSFDELWNKSVLMWISGSEDILSYDIDRLLQYLYLGINGVADADDIEKLKITINVAAEIGNEKQVEQTQEVTNRLEHLKQILLRVGTPENIKHRQVAIFWDSYRGVYTDAVAILYKEGLLPLVTENMGIYAIKEIIRQLASRTFRNESLFAAVLICDWLDENALYVDSHRNNRDVNIWAQLILWLSNIDPVARNWTSVDVIHAFLTFLFVENEFDTINELIIEYYLKRTEESEYQRIVDLTEKDKTNVHDKDKESSTSEKKQQRNIESLASTGMSDNARRKLLEHFLHYQPRSLLLYIRHTVATALIGEERWSEWLFTDELKALAYSISVSATELLFQTIQLLRLDDKTERRIWAAYISRFTNEEWLYNTTYENVCQYIDLIYEIRGGNTSTRDKVLQTVVKSLGLEIEEKHIEDEVFCMKVGNAGLCLLAPWFLRLFDMLGYLDTEHRMFRSTSSKIRAVFLLQYLVYGEELEYKESDLLFNRLLADLSIAIPLPRQLSLTEMEKETADSMIAGVKANWQKMNGTSVEGFRKSFISRSGVMDRPDDHWIITVDENAYDILLDTVPWGFRQIRLPWIKTFIQVVWHDKQII